MPTYDYRCNDCSNEFELVQKISEEPGGECPKCGSSDVKRLLSASAFHLKGTGWYKTDYGASANNSNGSSSGEAKSSTESSKSDMKADKAATSSSNSCCTSGKCSDSSKSKEKSS